MILENIHTPADVKALDREQLEPLCRELRQFLVEHVSKTGGHLASNLGAVELTVAIHRVFDTSKDRLVFDVGHQCYVHKALTGRQALFDTLRQFGGLSGFPKPRESEHDAFIAGHASNSVAVAVGMVQARAALGQDYQVAALIGDGALTGGLAYEGLSMAGQSGEPLVVILNDNGMSITKNIVDLMGGTIAIESEPGKGSEFIVNLCFALSGQKVELRQLPQLEGLRALVADDDTDTCLSVSTMLSKIGMRPEWTISGKEAVIRTKYAVERGD